MAQAKISVNADGSWQVVIGHIMEDWEKSELIQKFRREFSSVSITETGSGTNISGAAPINSHF